MDEINQVWPKWRTIEILGRGGFGTVYKAKRDNFGDETYSAIKIVKIPNDDTEIREMTDTGMSEDNIKDYYHRSVLSLVDEIKLMEKLKSSANIVGIEDFEVIENEKGIGWTIYIRMELLTNISDYFKQKALEVKDVVKMGIDICSALEHCHDSKIIHRDIKPGNIFISKFGDYKLGDFGVSKEVEKSMATLSQKGTKSYMAPEMVRMSKYGKNVDLYALGLTMYELLNHGRMPFLPTYPTPFYPEDREMAMEKRLLGEVFPRIENIGSLNEIIQKACAFDPKDRYQNANEMKQDLKQWLYQEDNKIIEKQAKIEEDEDKTIGTINLDYFGSDNDEINFVEEEVIKEEIIEEEKEEMIPPSKPKSKMGLIIVAAVVVVAMVGGIILGTMNKSNSSTNNVNPSSSNTLNTNQNTTDDLLAKIQANGEIVVGIEDTINDGWHYVRGSEIGGLDVEIIKAIADKLNVECQFVVADSNTLNDGLKDGTYDTIIVSQEMSLDDGFVYSDAYAYIRNALLVTKDEQLSTNLDLSGLYVGVYGDCINSITYSRLETENCEIKTYIEVFLNKTGSLEDLFMGITDALIVDEVTYVSVMNISPLWQDIEHYVLNPYNEYRTFHFPFYNVTDENYTTRFMNQFNDLLEELRSDGTLQTLSEDEWTGLDVTDIEY